MVRYICTSVFGFVLLALFSIQPAFSASESKNSKIYGNCIVETYINLLTDKERHFFGCEDKKTSTAIIIFHHPETSFTLSLQSGRQSWPLDTTSVALRFYPGPVIKRPATKWINSIRAAQIEDQQFISSLLPQIASGGRLVIKVGIKSGIINLTGSAQAIQDFQQRIGNRPQSLEIPAAQRF